MLNLHTISRILLRFFSAPAESSTLDRDEEWERDPLSHPAVQRMSLEQVADLPFDRGACREPAGHAIWTRDDRFSCITES